MEERCGDDSGSLPPPLCRQPSWGSARSDGVQDDVDERTDKSPKAWSVFDAHLRRLAEEYCSAHERLAREFLEPLRAGTPCNEGQHSSLHRCNVMDDCKPAVPKCDPDATFAKTFSLPARCPSPSASSTSKPSKPTVSFSEKKDEAPDLVCQPKRRNEWQRQMNTRKSILDPPGQRKYGSDSSSRKRVSRLLAVDDDARARQAAKLAMGRDGFEQEPSVHSAGSSFDSAVHALVNVTSFNKLEAAFVSTTTLHKETSVGLRLQELGYKMHCLEHLVSWWSGIAEPRRTGCLAALEQHKVFELLCAIVIMANTLFIVFTTNADMSATMAGSPSVNAYTLYTISGSKLEKFFFVFYVCELTLRLWVHKHYFFCNEDCSWNWLDFFLVSLSVMELLLTTVKTSFNKMFMRILRLLKVSKLLRVFRAVRFLWEMRQFVERLRGCVMSLFWASVVIALVLLVFSLFFVQAMAIYWREHSGGGEDALSQIQRDDITFYFGTVYRAMVTLLEICVGHGDWEGKYLLISDTGIWNANLFIFFTVFFTVAVWNIVTSVFLENTIRVSQPDREAELLEKHRHDVEDAKELMRILRMADVDRSGMVSLDEFEEFMTNETFREYFDMRGIDVKDTEMFFHMIATSTGCDEVDLEAFVGSCLRVKGTATSIDLHTLAFEAKVMHQLEKRFHAFVEGRFNSLDDQLTMLGARLRSELGAHRELELGVVALEVENSRVDDSEYVLGPCKSEPDDQEFFFKEGDEKTTEESDTPREKEPGGVQTRVVDGRTITTM
eukprot:TRINITY_DN8599_c0_g1_i1.p1 TRINITY_DN8599_c0_g1~~TRINITY_DN8599_c0_g1_i1.p1  ORF type:complete len:779 (+),score=176.52 TRINITY_DN8599_c0_g1_i1:131-2467(+)